MSAKNKEQNEMRKCNCKPGKQPWDGKCPWCRTPPEVKEHERKMRLLPKDGALDWYALYRSL